MPVVLLSWKAVNKGALRGFACIRLGRSLKINDVTVLRSGERAWCGLPGKPMLDKDNQAKINDKGKIAYVPVLEWENKAASDAFSEAVIAAVEAEHPGETA